MRGLAASFLPALDSHVCATGRTSLLNQFVAAMDKLRIGPVPLVSGQSQSTSVQVFKQLVLEASGTGRGGVRVSTATGRRG